MDLFQSVSLHGFQRKEPSDGSMTSEQLSFNPSHFTDSRESISGNSIRGILREFQSVSLHGFQRKTEDSQHDENDR